MKSENVSIRFENVDTNEVTARLGDYTGVGTTRDTAMIALGQRIGALPNAERNTVWGSGQQTQAAG